MSNVIMIIILAIMMVPLYLIFAFFPYLTKRTICMGVSIPEDRFSDERLKAIRNTYTVSLLVTGALVTGFVFAARGASGVCVGGGCYFINGFYFFNLRSGL